MSVLNGIYSVVEFGNVPRARGLPRHRPLKIESDPCHSCAETPLGARLSAVPVGGVPAGPWLLIGAAVPSTASRLGRAWPRLKPQLHDH